MADAGIGVNMEGKDKEPVVLHTLVALKVSGMLLVLVNDTSPEEANSSLAKALLSLDNRLLFIKNHDKIVPFNNTLERYE